MKDNRKKVIINYSVALLTNVCIISGAFGNLFYYIGGIALLVLYAVILFLLSFIYKYVHRRFNNDEWTDDMVYRAVVVPLALGIIASIVIIL